MMNNIKSLVAIAKILIWTSFEKAYQLLPLLFITTLLASCTAKYVEIEDPSKKIELSCYSIITPWEAKWYWWSFIGGGLGSSIKGYQVCENRAKFVTGGGKDIYVVDFHSEDSVKRWKDKFSNEFLLEQGEKFIKSEEKNLLEHKEFTIENINFENEIVQGVKEICAKMKTEYSFSTSKPFYYKTRGQTGEEIEFKLNPSDKYFFESIEFIVIEGPYKSWPYNLALTYQVKFTHISVNENIDPELEARALNFLKNLEVTLDWEKEVVE